MMPGARETGPPDPETEEKLSLAEVIGKVTGAISAAVAVLTICGCYLSRNWEAASGSPPVDSHAAF